MDNENLSPMAPDPEPDPVPPNPEPNPQEPDFEPLHPTPPEPTPELTPEPEPAATPEPPPPFENEPAPAATPEPPSLENVPQPIVPETPIVQEEKARTDAIPEKKDVKPPKKKSFLKSLLKLFVLFVVLIVVAIATMPFYSSFLIPTILDPISKTTGRKSNLQNLSVSIFGSQVKLENFQIKEENGQDDFLKIDKVDINFEIMPLLNGNVEIPNFEVSGVYLNVTIDESGKPSFQSIADNAKASQPASTPETTTPTASEPLTKLPSVNAHVKLNNINVTLKDKRSNQTIEIKNFNWDADVKDLGDITYHSKWDQAKYNGESQQLLLSLVYELTGKLALELKDGKVAIAANGSLVLSQIQSQRKEQTMIKDGKISFVHDLNLDPGQGTVDVKKLGMESDYVVAMLSDVQLRNLLEFQNVVEQLASAQKPETFQALLPKLPIEAWRGKFHAQLFLDRVQKDFGQMINDASQGKVSEIGGTILLDAELQGKPQGLEIHQKLSVKDVYVTGKLPQDDGSFKPYRVALQVEQKFDNTTDLQKRRLTNHSFIELSTPGNDPKNPTKIVLAKAEQKSLMVNGATIQDWKLIELDDSVAIDFDAISQVLSPFLPQGTAIKGNLLSKNFLKPTKQPNQLHLTGETQFKAEIISPKLPKKLPALEIAGSRDMLIGVDDKYIPQKFQINKFTLQSVGSQLIQLTAQGKLDLTGVETPNLKMSAAIRLQELQPYISPFVEGIQLSGELNHTLDATTKDQEITLNNQGKLTGFMLNVPNMKGPISPLRLANTEWASKLVLAKPADANQIGVVIRPSYLLVKQDAKNMLQCNWEGSFFQTADQKPSIPAFKLTTQVWGKPLLTIIPPEVIQDAKLKQMLTQDITLDGHAIISLAMQATDPKDVNLQINADLTPLIVKFQDPELGLVADKQATIPVKAQATLRYQKQATSEILTLQKCQAQFAKITIPIGDLMVKDKAHITALDGTSSIVLIQIPKFALAELFQVLPICKQMKLDNATIELRLDQFLAHLPEEDIQGKLFFRCIIPEMDAQSLMATIKKRREAKEEKAIEQIMHGERPLMVFGHKLQKSLKKIGLDAEIKLEKLAFDRINRGSEWNVSLKLNDVKPDNLMKLSFTGKLGLGTIDIKGLADLDRDHPKWNFKYNLNRLPFLADLFGPVTDKVHEHVRFPLLDKMQFKDRGEMIFNLRGENTCYGLDPRGMKRSLVSNEDMILEIPSGRFDLGFDVGKFMDPETIKKELGERLAPLEAAIKQLKGDQQGAQAQVTQLEGQVKTIREKIADFRSKREPILDGIKKTELLAKYQPNLRERIKQAREQVTKYDGMIAEQEKQATVADKALAQARARIDDFRKQIQAKEAELAQKREELQSKLQIANPFKFDFNDAQIRIKISNDQPWAGDGDLTSIATHPFSKLEFNEIKFQPESPDMPKLRGWSTLDNRFEFQAIPSPSVLDKLKDRLPGIIPAIREKGVLWRQDGFEPNPLQLANPVGSPK